MNEKIIDIGKKPFVDEVLEDVINHRLESCGGISETKTHDRELKESKVASKSSLPFLAFLHPDQIEARLEVNLGEDG